MTDSSEKIDWNAILAASNNSTNQTVSSTETHVTSCNESANHVGIEYFSSISKSQKN